MRKTKASLSNPPHTNEEGPREARETEIEENYEAIAGESSTEGVGPGYDADDSDASEDEKAETSADGPLSGDTFDPPTSLKPKKKKNKHGIHPPNSKSNHAAANSSKTI